MAESRDAESGALAQTEPFQLGEPKSVEQLLTAADTSTLVLAADADRYGAGQTLGEGGMGIVRLDQDRRVGRRVARKFLRRGDDAQSVKRFLREARIQGQLEHPAIPPVYDIGRAPDGGLYFTMKRLRGITMEQILAGLAKGDDALRERFPRRRLLSALLTVCDALAYAHARGVVHRDLKPANVMLGDYGEVWVLDWGIARLTDDADQSSPLLGEKVRPEAPEVSNGRLTTPGQVVGTVHYISPEQLEDRPLDGRADVFSLGMMLFEVLTLRRYRDNEGWMRLMTQLQEGDPARPSDVVPGIEPELDAICQRATAPDRSKRYGSVTELHAALDGFLAGERDADSRRASGTRIVKNAQKRLEECERAAGGDTRLLASARADAMHEALRALAVDTENADAKRLVGSLVERVTGDPPPAADEEVRRARARLRHEGMRAARLGLLSCVLPLPLMFLAGVRDWAPFIMGIYFLVAGIALTTERVAKGESQPRDGYVMAGLISCLIVLISGYLGPFVVVPTCGNAAAMLFAMHATRDERIRITAMLAFATIVPFAIDASGLVPAGFEFVGDTIVLHPRLVGIPPLDTVLVLLWVSASFTVVSAYIIGRMRDRMDDAERRLHVSVWHLRQLFPAAATVGDAR